MKVSVFPRKAANVPDSLRKRLQTYTLAASAAGVSLLAAATPGPEAEIIYTMYALAASAAGVSLLAQPAEAEIIYTATHASFGPMGSGSGHLWSVFGLDLTGNGRINFSFNEAWHTSTWSSGKFEVENGYLTVNPFQGNGVVVAGRGVAALRPGVLIGPNAKFAGGGLMGEGLWKYPVDFGHSSKCDGPWADKGNRYLGLKFIISGQVHYGWAQLSVSCSYGGVYAWLTGYAYENIPNKGLKSGQQVETKVDENPNGTAEPAPLSYQTPVPATLGMLARGAPALSIWRLE
jgi:hypothetical protein